MSTQEDTQAQEQKQEDGGNGDFEPLVNSEAVEAGEERGDAEFTSTQTSGRYSVQHQGAISVNPSDIGNPYVGQEDQDMEIRPSVLGPPAYASPDPNTLTGRLVPLTQHARAIRGELDEDYAKDVQEVVSDPLYPGGPGTPDGSDMGEGGLLATDAANIVAEGEEGGTDYNAQTVADLKTLASEREIEGASAMNKADLVAAHEAYDAENA